MNVSLKHIGTVKRGITLATIIVALTCGVAWGMGSRVPAVGMQAEDFQLVDLEGKTQSLSQYRGKIVLVNFWATWCKPCTTEMPAMQTMYDKLRDKGFVVLAVNELEDEAKVREHIRAYGHTFPGPNGSRQQSRQPVRRIRITRERLHRPRGTRAGIYQRWAVDRRQDQSNNRSAFKETSRCRRHRPGRIA